MRRRALVAAAVLAVALVVADLCVGAFLIEDGRYEKRPLPPFGLHDSAEKKEALRKALEKMELPNGRYVVQGGYHPTLGWINRRGTKKVGRNTVSFNSIGARGTRELDAQPPEGVVRVACYGESFTFGSEVTDGDDWPSQLDVLEEDFEVVNMGVGGYGQDQTLLLFRETGPSLDADVVMIGMLLENIGRNVARLRQMWYPLEPGLNLKPRFVLEDGELRLVPIPFENKRAAYQAALDGTLLSAVSEHEYWAGDDPFPSFSSIARILAFKRAYKRRQVNRLWMDVEAEPYRVTLALLEALHAEALASGAEHAVVLVFPDRQDIARLTKNGSAYYGQLLADLEANGIEYVDFGEVLLPFSKNEDLYLGSHFTPRANGYVALKMRHWLRQRYPDDG